GSPVRQEDALEDLVRAVGGEHPLGGLPVSGGDGGPQLGGAPVWVAVPADPGHRLGELVDELLRRGYRRLVGVEADLHVDLRRVVALGQREVVADGGAADRAHGRTPPTPARRSLMDSAWASSPSASAMATTCPATAS